MQQCKEELPKLPGFNFNDPTRNSFQLSQTFYLKNGFKLSKTSYRGVGQRELDANSVRYLPKHDIVPFDPSLIYGRLKSIPNPKFQPQYVLYDKKCLNFKAFFKQLTPESPLETFRIRHCNIIYFLEDDTITVMEPRVQNSGLTQGRYLKRGKIPKNEFGNFWHWKDLAVGRNYNFYGTIYRTVDCDAFSREYMASQGLIMEEAETAPADPYTEKKVNVEKQIDEKHLKKLKRNFGDDRLILRFKALWEQSNSKRKFDIYYFVANKALSVKEIFGRNEGTENAQLLKKAKIPKNWSNDIILTFPSDSDVEYYQPEDFKIGENISIMGRQMLLYDCDEFTRHFYKNILKIEQSPSINVVLEEKVALPPPVMPPHNGIGSLEDSLQNTKTFQPKPPKKDVIKQILNANKYLRYEMKFVDPLSEDSGRRFLLFYSLADNSCRIYEPRIRNSGMLGGKYLRSTLLIKPNSDPINPEYYSPVDFYIGAEIIIFNRKFVITGADLHVYKYMEANPSKFPPEAIENVKCFMLENGFLDLDTPSCEELREKENMKKNLLEIQQNEIEKGLQSMNIDIIVSRKAEEKEIDFI